jgi:hypothetical protein
VETQPGRLREHGLVDEAADERHLISGRGAKALGRDRDHTAAEALVGRRGACVRRAAAKRGHAADQGLKLSGLLAWIVWLTVHLFYLVGFQNRVLVFIRWSVSFVTRGRGARLIIGE